MHCDSCILKNIRALHPKSIYLMFSIWSKTTLITVGMGMVRCEPAYLKNVDIFSYVLDNTYANFQQKI